MALDPWLAASSVTVLSENLTILLLSTAVFFVSRLEIGEPRSTTAGFLGSTMAAVSLTAPHTLPLAAAVMAWGAWRLKSRARAVASMAIGFVAVMTPWQLHCLHAQGYVNPFVYNASGYAFQSSSGYIKWVKTWVITS